ncbi:OLC1v1004314C1 [Oldenlandia corymbosa var. corymbosa]|uniref:OLC1v1004314C1 n=1 Tax=Oldenlandia corymbosa var. corymbosa TaxID=529605 RepID=A0AAV1DC20_OLDCO|nr:OLC1v1004314C1 [Oldenlandia corymbosa var. corymbosa]
MARNVSYMLNLYHTRGEHASTSRNRDEEETPLFAQDDYREESDSDYIAPSESEEDCDVSGESDFEESDDERTFNVESEDGELPCDWKMRVSLKAHGLHEIMRWHDAHNCMTPLNDNDNRCVDASLIARLIKRKVEDNVDYTVAPAQKDVKTLLKVDVPYKRAWHGRRKAIEAVYGDWTSNFEELPRYIAALKFTNPETVVEWEWKEGQEVHRHWNRREEYVLRDLEEGDPGSVYEGYYEWFIVNTIGLISNPGNYEPQGYETSSSRVKLYGEVLNNIRVSTERFREKREDDNLLDEELDKYLDDIINQTHAALTLGANDEMEV